MVSAIGSQFARVGLYVQVYALTGSPAAVGLLGVSGLIGSFGGVLVGSAFIDRHDRRVTLIWTELAAVGVSGVLFAGALAGRSAAVAPARRERRHLVPRGHPRARTASGDPPAARR